MAESSVFIAHLPGILLAYSVLLVAIFSPGPAVLAIMGTAMNKGRRPAVFLTFGVISGSAFWGVSAAIGLAGLLNTYANVLILIKIAGGLYLLWLALKSFQNALEPTMLQPTMAGRRNTAGEMWLTGLLIHLTNPKAIVGWIAVISLGVNEATPIWVSLAIVTGGVLISLLGHLAYALVFSTAPMANAYLRLRRPIQFALAGFFGIAGLKLLTSRA